MNLSKVEIIEDLWDVHRVHKTETYRRKLQYLITRNNDKINIRQMFRRVEEMKRWKGKYEVRVIIEKHSFSVPVTILAGRSSEKTFQVPSPQLASQSITLKEGQTIATFSTKEKDIRKCLRLCMPQWANIHCYSDRQAGFEGLAQFHNAAATLCNEPRVGVKRGRTT